MSQRIELTAEQWASLIFVVPLIEDDESLRLSSHAGGNLSAEIVADGVVQNGYEFDRKGQR